MSNEPIEPQNYIGGVTVVDFGEIRVSRGKSRFTFSTCPHLKLNYDSRTRRIWCKDCETDIRSFDAFVLLVEQQDAAIQRAKRLQDEANKAVEQNLRRIVAKKLDQEWSKRKTIPRCPHCKTGLLPEDFKDINLISKALEEERRK